MLCVKVLTLTTGLVTTALLSGCVVKPERLPDSSVAEYANEKLARVTEDQEPIHGKVDLSEAMARALKYNLDHKVEQYNHALKLKELGSANQAGLPSIVAGLNSRNRNNVSGSYSNSGNPPSDNPSGNNNGSFTTSSERNTIDGNVEFSWNILDFGLSYAKAKQSADRVLIAEEQRRKIVNRLIEDVRTAYWRAVSSQRLLAGLRRLAGKTEIALRDARKLEQSGDTSPLTSLTYQRELVDIKDELQKLETELSTSKRQLAALMNLRPDTKYSLVVPKFSAKKIKLVANVEEMTQAALLQRSELRENAYRDRINLKEAKVALLELLPSANLFLGGNYDSNGFVYNADWISWGLRASWNVMRVFKYPQRKGLIKAESSVIDQQALAITMAIITQVHASRVRFFERRRRFATARQRLSIQNRILKQIRDASSVGNVSDQAVIREEMNTLVARIKHDIAYSDLQNAYANVYASIGFDPLPVKQLKAMNISSISKELEINWKKKGDFNIKSR